MKNLTKKSMTTILLVIVFSFTINGQTNVSGGIYSNTTWTYANSPYIVVDTVVVFPGVTLTIQPGVKVKFNDNKRLEIRQGSISALGTLMDSIIFTSNSSSPSSGKWSEILLNQDVSSVFDFCHFNYAKTAVSRYNSDNNQTLYIKNSTFDHNLISLDLTSNNFSNSFIDSCTFRNNKAVVLSPTNLSKIITMNYCTITNNQTGIDFAYSTIQNSIIESNDTAIKIHLNDNIINCQIRYNTLGILNQYISSTGGNVITGNEISNNVVGISLNIDGDDISSNQICNNTSYNLKYLYTGGNTDVSNNCWCSLDSSIVSAKIYDGYDNFNYGLVHFMPFDTSQSCLIASVPTNTTLNYSFDIFPNPTSNFLTIVLPRNISTTEIKIFNILGELEYSSETTNPETNMDVSILQSGLHIIQIASNGRISRQKFIKQ